MRTGAALVVVVVGATALTACSTVRGNTLCTDRIRERVGDLLAAVDTPSSTRSGDDDPVVCADSVDSVHGSRAFVAAAATTDVVANALRSDLAASAWGATAPAGGATFAFTRRENGQAYWAEIGRDGSREDRVVVTVSAGDFPY